MEPFIGQIMMFGGNFAPRGWAICDGQLLPINQWDALFSILGTTYGGDGRTSFGLPDLRGRVAMGEGQGPGLSPHPLGQKSGNEFTQLTTANLPAHNHDVRIRGEGAQATTSNPTDQMFAAPSTPIYAPDSTATEALLNARAVSEQSVGSGTAFSNEQPYQVVNYIIALQGIYPSRS